MELNVESVADSDLGRVGDDVAGIVGGDGVAALEDFERAALLQLEQEAFPALALVANEALFAGGEFLRDFVQAQAQRTDSCAKVEMGHSQARDVQAFARILELRTQTQSQARGQLIGPLALLAQEIEGAAKTAATGERVDVPR